ncbi:MAG TPA: SMP-30/gluconolactonase/LRE family protein [Steroidobacteraceae bacterium]|jgi:sugar lactone lactonase YvrE|nr:SMP-30/gluconolactonase/LRE family protein [Steroidobacteraceae bacterium]
MTTTINSELIEIVSVGNTLGEGVLWDPLGQRAWWTDIQERRLFRYDPRSRELESFDLPERLCSFGFIEGSDKIVAAFESGFARYHPESARLQWLSRPRHEASNVRFNDGRIDRQGRFWAGSMVEGKGEPKGKLYCLGPNGVKVCLTGISISNSICFSPDGKHLYFADSPQRTILRFDIDPASGTIGNRQIFAKTPKEAFPDGANVDDEGCLWSAHWGAGRVVRYAPDGSIDAVVEVPTTQVSCVAFGGAALDLLFVTSAREGMSAAILHEQPHAGDVFVYKVNVKGLPDLRFAMEPVA